MLAYAASRPRFAARQSSPNAMLVILTAHIVLIAAIVSIKMEAPQKIFGKPIEVELISPPTPPPERFQQPRTEQRAEPKITQSERAVPLPPMPSELPGVDASPKLPDIGDLLGAGAGPLQPRIEPKPLPLPGPTEARLITPASELKPPYPESKLLSGEEALLTLRLTVDAQGRVVGVEPVGRVDRAFLDAARRHLTRHWRYSPATEGGRAVMSQVTIRLRFQLD